MDMSVGNAHPFQLASLHSGVEIIKAFQPFVVLCPPPPPLTCDGFLFFNVPSTGSSPALQPQTFALFESLCSFASDAWADQLREFWTGWIRE